MGKVLKAKYDASKNALGLVEPLEGVQDEETVTVTVEKPVEGERPWLAFSGIMSGEDGEDFARAIGEMFPLEQE